MKLLALALAVGPIATGPGTMFFAGMPPERFQGAAIVKLVVARPESLPALCDYTMPETPPEQHLELKGCARTDIWGRPYIVIADPCPMGAYEETATILCHELAHTRGWAADHPL